MFNRTETDERKYLEDVKQKLDAALGQSSLKVSRYAQEVREQKTYIWENKGDMDHVEKVSARQSAEQIMRSGEAALSAKLRLQKLIQSPYFGRFDFKKTGNQGHELPVYIGIHSFMDQTEQRGTIFDWRAPISSMFYDFELGQASYHSPNGEVRGEITLKRQFRIRRGRIEFMLESGLNILDDVLQEELSRTSDDRMKNIVATIQRDQNAIIRNEDAEVLIIQGVAGSGKTSIALHRIAFLLYKFNDSLSSDDILIISPNKVFADFISDVLPELGEEQIPEMGMEELADELLGRKYKFQTYFEQSSALIDGEDQELIRRVGVKAAAEFLEKLDSYINHVEESRFNPGDLRVRDQVVPALFLERAFKQQPGLPLPSRLRWVADRAEQEARVKWEYELTGKEKAELKTAVRKMARNAALLTLYREFYTWIGNPELFKRGRGSLLEYSDVFPLIYLKFHLLGVGHGYRHIRHLVVDEMQDYTPVQYAVLALLFPCDKTILGDSNQSLNTWGAGSAEVVSQVFPFSERVKLCKSYRSSYEITQFAQSILPDADLVAIERHGNRPQIVEYGDEAREREGILEAIASFSKRRFRTIGIICKTPKQAEQLFEDIKDQAPDIHLLSPGSTEFVGGVLISSVHLAKGLEFDCVFVPYATEKNYASQLDRSLLYVACTRAMHELILTHVGPYTRFISDSSLYQAA